MMFILLTIIQTAVVILVSFIRILSAQKIMDCLSDCICSRPDLNILDMDCSRHHFTEIPKKAIPSNIRTLNFKLNQIHALNANQFKGMKNLIKLDLSNNAMRYIEPQAFQTITKLQELKLQYNQLKSIPYFAEENALSHLYIQHNDITQLTPLNMRNLGELITLDLGFNNISRLVPGTFTQRNQKLRQLFLNNNYIGNLYDGFFDDLSSLEWLKLSKNRIYELPDLLFAKLPKLKYLEINRNKLHTLRSLAFNGLKSLEILKIKRNNINKLMDGAFFGLDGIISLQLDNNEIDTINRNWLYGLTHLENLSLSFNKITQFDPHTWEPVANLKELDLSHNAITRLEQNAFEYLPQLRVLRLNGNQIKYVHIDAFRNLESLIHLDMSFNQFTDALAQSHTFHEDESYYTAEQSEKSPQNQIQNRQSYLGKSRSTLVTNALCHLSSLAKLNLEDNSIETLDISSDNLCLVKLLSNAQLKIFNANNNPINRIHTDSILNNEQAKTLWPNKKTDDTAFDSKLKALNQTSILTQYPLSPTIKQLRINTTMLICDCDTLLQVPLWFNPWITEEQQKFSALSNFNAKNTEKNEQTPFGNGLHCLAPYHLTNLNVMDLKAIKENSETIQSLCSQIFSMDSPSKTTFSNTNRDGTQIHLNQIPNGETKNIETLLQYPSTSGQTNLTPTNDLTYLKDAPQPENPLLAILGKMEQKSMHKKSNLLTAFIPYGAVSITRNSEPKMDVIRGTSTSKIPMIRKKLDQRFNTGNALICNAEIAVLHHENPFISLPKTGKTVYTKTKGILNPSLMDQHEMLEVVWEKGNQVIDARLASNDRHYKIDEIYYVKEKSFQNEFGNGERYSQNGTVPTKKSKLKTYVIGIRSKLLLYPIVNDVHSGTYKCVAQSRFLQQWIEVYGYENLPPSLFMYNFGADLINSAPLNQNKNNGRPFGTTENQLYRAVSPRMRVSVLVSPYLVTNSDPFYNTINKDDHLTQNDHDNLDKFNQDQVYNAEKKLVEAHKIMTVRVGGTAKLECAAEGRPTPQVAWQKVRKVSKSHRQSPMSDSFRTKDSTTEKYEIADFPAARERRMRVIPSAAYLHATTNIYDNFKKFDKFHKLDLSLTSTPPAPKYNYRNGYESETFGDTQAGQNNYDISPGAFYITDVKLADAGIYLCRARNKAGTALLKLTLNVLELPFVNRPMTDKKLKVGQAAIFDCLAGGSPAPTINWLKDGEPIASLLLNHNTHVRRNKNHIENDRMFLAGQDKLLVIPQVTEQDAGTYECVLQNTLGKISHTARLIVEKDKSPASILSANYFLQGGDQLVNLLSEVDRIANATMSQSQSFAKMSKQHQQQPRHRKPSYDEWEDDMLDENEEDLSILSKPRDAVQLDDPSADESGTKSNALFNFHHPETANRKNVDSGPIGQNYNQFKGIVPDYAGGIRNAENSPSINSFFSQAGHNDRSVIALIVLAVITCVLLTSLLWAGLILRARKRRLKKINRLANVSFDSNGQVDIEKSNLNNLGFGKGGKTLSELERLAYQINVTTDKMANYKSTHNHPNYHRLNHINQTNIPESEKFICIKSSNVYNPTTTIDRHKNSFKLQTFARRFKLFKDQFFIPKQKTNTTNDNYYQDLSTLMKQKLRFPKAGTISPSKSSNFPLTAIYTQLPNTQISPKKFSIFQPGSPIILSTFAKSKIASANTTPQHKLVKIDNCNTDFMPKTNHDRDYDLSAIIDVTSGLAHDHDEKIPNFPNTYIDSLKNFSEDRDSGLALCPSSTNSVCSDELIHGKHKMNLYSNGTLKDKSLHDKCTKLKVIDVK